MGFTLFACTGLLYSHLNPGLAPLPLNSLSASAQPQTHGTARPARVSCHGAGLGMGPAPSWVPIYSIMVRDTLNNCVYVAAAAMYILLLVIIV